MISSKEIVEIFSYSADEQKSFNYLHRYMKQVNRKLPEIERDNEKLERFALAGLFLTYRAFNHTGAKMTTEMGDVSSENINCKRLGAFRDYFGTEIRDASHYLSMINFSKLHFVLLIFRLTDISRKLYSFVVR